jgi:ceramidase
MGSRRARLWILLAVTFGCIVLTALLPRIPQNPAYHEFADQRSFFGIPNCLNVISNAPFLLVGWLGLAFLFQKRRQGEASPFLDPQERWPYAVFFLGVALTSAGSWYYHLAPGNSTLLWDRLPMTFAFMSFFAAVVVERISLRAGLWLLAPLVILGIASVFYWSFTEAQGRGDLRPYGLVQAYPLLGVPLLIVLFPAKYTRTGDLLTVGGIYVLAKLFELLDHPIFGLGRVVSGHTLKHLVAALSAYWALRMLELRSPMTTGASEAARSIVA